MKKLLAVLFILSVTQLGLSQKDVFEKVIKTYKEKGLVKFNLNGDFDFSNDINKNVSAKINDASINMEHIRRKQSNIHLIVLGDEANFSNQAFKSLSKDFEKAGYKDLMIIRKGKNNVSLLGYESGNRYNNLAVLIKGESGGAVLLSFTGDYTQKDIDTILKGR